MLFPPLFPTFYRLSAKNFYPVVKNAKTSRKAFSAVAEADCVVAQII
jgi:hypothetical protein